MAFETPNDRPASGAARDVRAADDVGPAMMVTARTSRVRLSELLGETPLRALSAAFGTRGGARQRMPARLAETRDAAGTPDYGAAD